MRQSIMILVMVLVMLLGETRGQHQVAFQPVSGDDKTRCTSRLLEHVPDSAFTASSVLATNPPEEDKSDLAPSEVPIMTAASIKSSTMHWCPAHGVSSDPSEYVEIDLANNHVITSLKMGSVQGKLAKKFQVWYRRSGTQWLKYTEKGSRTLLGMRDARIPRIVKFGQPFVARWFRIYPLHQPDQQTPAGLAQVCISIDLYGCPFTSHLTEYQMLQGDLSADTSYDGQLTGPQLTQGLGLLTNLRHADSVVAWTGQPHAPLEILFRFSQVMQYSAVKLYFNITSTFALPDRLELLFSCDTASNNVSLALNQFQREIAASGVHLVTVQLDQAVIGQTVRLRLSKPQTHSLSMSEVEFVNQAWIPPSPDQAESDTTRDSKPGQEDNALPTPMTSTMTAKSDKLVESENSESAPTSKFGAYATLITVLVLLFSLLLLVTAVFVSFSCFWLVKRRRRKERRRKQQEQQRKHQQMMLRCDNSVMPLILAGSNNTPPKSGSTSLLDDYLSPLSVATGTVNNPQLMAAMQKTTTEDDSVSNASMAQEFMQFLRRLFPRSWSKFSSTTTPSPPQNNNNNVSSTTGSCYNTYHPHQQQQQQSQMEMQKAIDGMLPLVPREGESLYQQYMLMNMLAAAAAANNNPQHQRNHLQQQQAMLENIHPQLGHHHLGHHNQQQQQGTISEDDMDSNLSPEYATASAFSIYNMPGSTLTTMQQQQQQHLYGNDTLPPTPPPMHPSHQLLDPIAIATMQRNMAALAWLQQQQQTTPASSSSVFFAPIQQAPPPSLPPPQPPLLNGSAGVGASAMNLNLLMQQQQLLMSAAADESSQRKFPPQ